MLFFFFITACSNFRLESFIKNPFEQDLIFNKAKNLVFNGGFDENSIAKLMGINGDKLDYAQYDKCFTEIYKIQLSDDGDRQVEIQGLLSFILELCKFSSNEANNSKIIEITCKYAKMYFDKTEFSIKSALNFFNGISKSGIGNHVMNYFLSDSERFRDCIKFYLPIIPTGHHLGFDLLNKKQIVNSDELQEAMQTNKENKAFDRMEICPALHLLAALEGIKKEEYEKFFELYAEASGIYKSQTIFLQNLLFFDFKQERSLLTLSCIYGNSALCDLYLSNVPEPTNVILDSGFIELACKINDGGDFLLFLLRYVIEDKKIYEIIGKDEDKSEKLKNAFLFCLVSQQNFCSSRIIFKFLSKIKQNFSLKDLYSKTFLSKIKEVFNKIFHSPILIYFTKFIDLLLKLPKVASHNISFYGTKIDLEWICFEKGLKKLREITNPDIDKEDLAIILKSFENTWAVNTEIINKSLGEIQREIEGIIAYKVDLTGKNPRQFLDLFCLTTKERLSPASLNEEFTQKVSTDQIEDISVCLKKFNETIYKIVKLRDSLDNDLLELGLITWYSVSFELINDFKSSLKELNSAIERLGTLFMIEVEV